MDPENGEIIKDMNITGPYIFLRVYLDGFATNNAIGTSAQKQTRLKGFSP